MHRRMILFKGKVLDFYKVKKMKRSENSDNLNFNYKTKGFNIFKNIDSRIINIQTEYII